MPNLVQLEETVIQELIDSQSVIPASACVEAADFDTSDILPRVLDEFTVEDTLWPVPFNTSNPVLYYNKKDFTEAGLDPERSEEHTSELQSLMRISYAVFCLKKKKSKHERSNHRPQK